MTKAELIEKISNENYCSKKDTEIVVAAVFDAIRDALTSGERVIISKFGTFEVRERNSRKCTNPKTGESVIVDPFRTPAFKPSKALKDAINES